MSESRESELNQQPTPPSQPTGQPPATPSEAPSSPPPAQAPATPTETPPPPAPHRAPPAPRMRDQDPGGAKPASFGQRGNVRSIHYTLSYVVANAERGPRGAIVLLHDLPGGAYTWEPILPALAATGRAVYAFDMLAYGQSSRPWPSDTSIWGHADALQYAFERLNLDEIVLVGLGLGGGVAQVLATRLVRERVAKLALLDTYAYEYAFAPDWPLPDMASHQDPEAPHHADIAQVLADLRQTLPTGSANPKGLNADRLRIYVDEWNSEIGKHLLYQHVRLMIGSYQNSPSSDLRRLEIPVLIGWGERDTVTPLALGERLAREIPGARLERLSGAGHLVVEDAPAALGTLLADFAGSMK